MKNSISKLITIVLILFFVNKIQAQKIQYFYFAPAATMQQAFGDKAKSFERKDHQGTLYTEMAGYKYVVLKQSNYDAFKTIAAPNMLKTYDRLTTNTSIKKAVDKIMTLSENKVNVNVMLADDRNAVSVAKLFCADKDTVDDKLYLWPCARIKKTGPSKYLGQVFLGEHFAQKDILRPGGFRNWEGTIIHEFSHTQLLPDPEFGKNKWKSIAIAYGGDDGHWSTELLADEQIAIDEGLGSFFGLAHNPVAAQNLIHFLNRKDHKFRLGSRSFLTGISAMWNSPHNVIYSGPYDKIPKGIKLVNTPLDGNYELRNYKWLDVPGKYLMYNEIISKAYFYLIHKYAFDKEDRAYARILMAVKDMAKPNVHDRYIGYAANHIARNMELYASSVPGKADKDNGVLVSSMITYGLIDLLTHFGMTEEDFKKYLRINQAGSELPIAYVKYWSQRAKLKALVCPHLGGNNCNGGQGNIDILKATKEMRDFFTANDLIIEQPF